MTRCRLVRPADRLQIRYQVSGQGVWCEREPRGAQVLDIGCCRQLTSRGNAIGEPAFKQERLELCTSCVDCGCVRCGS